ncbi:MAG: MarR family winged helix-turn-helix transcriptional regulator [Anderseniella sp.]|nr:MarR family winged helix-turn-helix transcriptional regulator [Anderseniella sp.]
MDDRPNFNGIAEVISETGQDVAPVSFLLKRAAQYSADLFAEQLGKTGLTQRQFTLMETVLANEGASQTELVKTTGIDRSTLADLVNRLETQGYVRRQRSSTDARVNFVFLTDHGRGTVLKAKPVAMLVDEALVNTLPDQLRHSFVQALEELSGKLDEDG